MKRRLHAGGFIATVLTMALVTPVSAHGDHDARPIARHMAAGPYIVSLWQVYPDTGVAMKPHLIVMFDDRASAPTEAVVTAAVNSMPMEIGPSITTANGWETMDGIAEGDVVSVGISDGSQAWDLEPVAVPPTPISMLPMDELLYSSIFLTLATAVWLARRAARAWRTPAVQAS